MEKSAANGSVRLGSASAGGLDYAKSVLRDRCPGDSRSFMKFAALFGAVFSKKSERHQKASLLPCREAKQHEARHHEARHYKKVGLSAFVAAMLCMGVAAQAATITVNSAVDALTDGGNCTLRGAVNAINAGSDRNNCVAVVSPDAYGSNDTITFDAAVFATPTTIDVTASGEIVITRSLTIEGLLDVDDAPLITLDGKSANRILNVSSAVSVLAVSGLAFQNGSVAGYSDGGAISANGSSTTVIVRNSTFENNQAAHYGGAIYARNIVNISDSTFEGNQSIGDGGGAIYASNAANISNSTFENNHAAYGGAIYTVTADVSDSTFRDNQTLIGSGGAIYARSVLNINGSVFSDNKSASYGGAIRADGTSVVAISNSTFSGNQAEGDYGGAIAFTGNTLRASHLTLLDNSAATNGAAIYYGGSGNGIIHNSLVLSSAALVGAPALCAVGGAGSIGGSYNIEWVNGADTTNCGGSNNVSGGSGAIGAIVETTLADNGGPTPTLALPAGSPAIGAVDPSGVTSQMFVIDSSQIWSTGTWEDATLDQRGVARATTPAERSIGAFEYKAPPPPPVNAAPIPVLPASLMLLLALGLAGVGFRRLKVAKS